MSAFLPSDSLFYVFLVVLVVGFGLFYWIQRIGRLSDTQAKAYLVEGALVVDVRPPARYAEKHLEGVVNLPALTIVEAVQPMVNDKSQVILCHCETGGLSGVAVRQLRKAGYTNAFNLGSYKRAASLL